MYGISLGDIVTVLGILGGLAFWWERLRARIQLRMIRLTTETHGGGPEKITFRVTNHEAAPEAMSKKGR